jgi:hypothetical protein
MQEPQLEQNKTTPLRKCRFCGLIASTEIELELFKINRKCKHGREEVCKYCHNEFKDLKHPPNPKKHQHTTWIRKCRFCGLEANTIEELGEFKTQKRSAYGRMNICTNCFNKNFVVPWNKNHRKKARKNNYDNDPVKYHCRIAAQRLPKKDKCEQCSSTQKLERHHPDHSKPTEFITLCHKCHNKLNRKPIVF